MPKQVNEAMTPGILNALSRNKNRTTCPGCGFPMPVYPGRYPSKCPSCDVPRGDASPAATEE
jgi:rubrerythrin